MPQAHKLIGLLLIITLALSIPLISSCTAQGEFGIYLKDTGELVLSEQHIKSFNPAENSFELNQSGIEKWNSYQTYESIPTLADSLHQKYFILKIDGTEICSGKFWSMLSSGWYPGVKITESIFKLDSTHNTIAITFDDKAQARQSIINYFQQHNKLK